jgi:hypothetical protein
MKPQFDNKVMSSFLLWFDHTLLNNGEAFANHTGKFYPADSLYNGFYTYSAPFKQFVSDFSITGTSIPTGIYLDGTFITPGQSGLTGINYDQGQVYFTSEITNAQNRLSGIYAIKDYNIYLTNESEERLLFETKFNLRPKTTQVETGLEPNQITYPAIFLRNNGGTNEPFALGGYDNTIMNVRAIVLADSQYLLDATCSIFRDRIRTFVTLLEESDMPYNALGGYKNAKNYNYTGIITGKISEDKYVFIQDISISKFNRDVNFRINNLNPGVFNGVIDFEISKPRYPRLAYKNEDL